MKQLVSSPLSTEAREPIGRKWWKAILRTRRVDDVLPKALLTQHIYIYIVSLLKYLYGINCRLQNNNLAHSSTTNCISIIMMMCTYIAIAIHASNLIDPHNN